jgi:hypothetical protein
MIAVIGKDDCGGCVFVISVTASWDRAQGQSFVRLIWMLLGFGWPGQQTYRGW